MNSQMKKYFFPIHLDGGNRGCEAIAKGSAMLIGEHADQLFGYCRDVKLDSELGLAQQLTLVPCTVKSPIVDTFLAIINKVFHTQTTMKWRKLYPYRSFLRLIDEGDVVLFTGGDMMCYDDNEIIYLNNWLHKRHVKTILWGCSMGPENQSEPKLRTLRNFSLVYTRESLTFGYFKSLGLKRLCMLPDPAFILPAETCPLPEIAAGNRYVGLNISNYVTGGMTLDSRFGKEVISLINYILDKTDLHILLIPHVTWNEKSVNQDDRQMAQIISAHFDNHPKIQTLNIDHLNYCQIRHAISRCSMFIGARTHAVISAYTMCVPAIALGYSIKSRGIAHDLGLSEQLVVNSKDFSEGDLTKSFMFLSDNENAIREHLKEVMPKYKEQTYSIKNYLDNLFRS